MNMSATTIFRGAIIASFIFTIAGVIATFSLGHTLPQMLQDYNAKVEQEILAELASTNEEDLSSEESFENDLSEVNVPMILFKALVALILSIIALLSPFILITCALWCFTKWERISFVIINAVSFGLIMWFSLSDNIPSLIQSYYAAFANDPSVEISSLSGALILSSLSIYIYIGPVAILTIGQWQFKKWARTIYVFCAVATLPLYFIGDAIVMNSWEATFFATTLLMEGAIIAMMYSGQIGQKFESTLKKEGRVIA